MQLDAEMLYNIEGILARAGSTLQSVHLKCATGCLDEAAIREMIEMHRRMGALLATFGDRNYNSGLAPEAIEAIAFYEAQAEDWIKALVATEDLTHKDDTRRIGPGRYIVVRTITTPSGKSFDKPVACNNPAYAMRELDKWQRRFMQDWEVEQAA